MNLLKTDLLKIFHVNEKIKCKTHRLFLHYVDLRTKLSSFQLGYKKLSFIENQFTWSENVFLFPKQNNENN